MKKGAGWLISKGGNWEHTIRGRLSENLAVWGTMPQLGEKGKRVFNQGSLIWEGRRAQRGRCALAEESLKRRGKGRVKKEGTSISQRNHCYWERDVKGDKG